MMKKLSLLIILLVGLLCSCSSSKSGSKALDKRNARTYYSYGTQSLLDKEYTKALGFLMKAVNFDDQDAEIHNNLAMAYYFKGQNLKAVAHLKKAIELKEQNSEAKNNLASIYFNMGKLNAAEALYLENLKDLVYAGQYRTYYNLALIAQRKGDQRNMYNYLTNSVNDKVDYCPSQYLLGNYYEQQKSYDKALFHYKKATLNDCFKEPAPNLALSLLLVKKRRWFDAEGRLTDFIKRFPKHNQIKLVRKNLQYVQQKLSEVKANPNAVKKAVQQSYNDLDKALDWEKSASSVKSPGI